MHFFPGMRELSETVIVRINVPGPKHKKVLVNSWKGATYCRINNGDHGLKHLGSVEFDVRDPVNIKHKTENCLVIMQNWELSTSSTDKFGLLIGSPCRSFQDKQENLRCRLQLRLY
jgi:hypothetical protein